MKLNILKELPRSFRASTLIAGWPGMGSVGIGAIDYIRRQLDAVAFAEIDMQSHFAPEAMIVEDGIAGFPAPPAHMFYAVEERDLVIFQSEAQIAGTPGDDLMEHILDMGQRLGVDTIFTGAAYLTQASHKEDAQVLGVANNDNFRDFLASQGVEILQEGMVSGLNGLLLGFCPTARTQCRLFVGARCRNTQPPFQIQKLPERLYTPWDACSILMWICRKSTTRPRKWKGTMEDIEMQIQKTFSHMGEGPEGEFQGGRAEDDKVPQSVMERIEKLFLEVTQTDQFHQKANELKAELDRWDLYSFLRRSVFESFQIPVPKAGDKWPILKSICTAIPQLNQHRRCARLCVGQKLAMSKKGEDPSVNALQAMVADMLGKEAALFFAIGDDVQSDFLCGSLPRRKSHLVGSHRASAHFRSRRRGSARACDPVSHRRREWHVHTRTDGRGHAARHAIQTAFPPRLCGADHKYARRGGYGHLNKYGRRVRYGTRKRRVDAHGRAPGF